MRMIQLKLLALLILLVMPFFAYTNLVQNGDFYADDNNGTSNNSNPDLNIADWSGITGALVIGQNENSQNGQNGQCYPNLSETCIYFKQNSLQTTQMVSQTLPLSTVPGIIYEVALDASGLGTESGFSTFIVKFGNQMRDVTSTIFDNMISPVQISFLANSSATSLEFDVDTNEGGQYWVSGVNVFPVSTVPEPSTWLLLGSGIIMLPLVARKKAVLQ